MAHLGARAFEEIGGEVVQTTSFVLQNRHIERYLGSYVRLVNYNSQQEKENAFLSTDHCPLYTAIQENFSKIPGSPIAYWASERFSNMFKNIKIEDIAKPRQGLATGDNEKFLRFWFEVSLCKIGFALTKDEANASGLKWFPCNKGGPYRKWYGNNYYVVNWENDGYDIRHIIGDNGKTKSRPQNTDYYFREGITWSTLSSGDFSMRISQKGSMFETKGSVCFPNNADQIYYILAYMNSTIAMSALKILCPTLDYHEGPIGKAPIIVDETIQEEVDGVSKTNIEISRLNWDSFETSWDFRRHPLI